MSTIHRLAPAALILLVAALAAPGAVLAAAPATWAWVVARHPSTGSYAPAAMDQGNSAGSTSRVTRTSLGHYRVDFPHLNATDGGDAQVSAMGSTGRYCDTNSWGPYASAGQISIFVACFDMTGASIDSAFTALFLTRGYNSIGVVSYMWADQPSTTDYSANPSYASMGGITVHRSAAGSYFVSFPGLDATHGNIQVTGYGGALCKTGDVGSEGGSMVVQVLCPAGDADYQILYTKNVGMTSVNRPKAAYLRALPSAAPGHQLPAAFRYSSTGSTPTLTRTGEGTYVVTLPGMPKGGYAHVTADQNTFYDCFLTRIRTSGTPQKIGVKCVTTLGSAQDAAFDLSYTK